MQCAFDLLSSVACPAVQYFSTLSHKRHDCRKKVLLNTKCVLWSSLQLLSETFFILRRTEREMIKYVYRSAACAVPLFLSVFNETNFLDRFSKNTQMSNFMKIRPVGAKLFSADRQTVVQCGQTDSCSVRTGRQLFSADRQTVVPRGQTVGRIWRS